MTFIPVCYQSLFTIYIVKLREACPPKILDQVSVYLLSCCTRYCWMVEFGGALKIRIEIQARELYYIKDLELGSCLIRNY